jgi:hypothetical protein
MLPTHRKGMQSGKFTPDLIAPCGMNCGVCKAYLSYSRGVPKRRSSVTHCSGCVPRQKNCYIKRGCEQLSKSKIRFCFECGQMPCENLDRLDRRYRKRHGMSMVENLQEIKAKGIPAFLRSQETKYTCPKCGDVVSVHDGKCYACGRSTRG